MSRICVIPARGGSVRIPRKNVRAFRGMPMLQRAIATAEHTGLFDTIIVSTDDDEIAYMAERSQAEVFRRKPDDGTAGTQDVVREVVEAYAVKHAAVCTLYPCTPLLTPDLIIAGGRGLGAANHVVSTYPGEARDAGAFYWQTAGALRARRYCWTEPTLAFPLPQQRCIDINTPEDWAQAEAMYDALHGA